VSLFEASPAFSTTSNADRRARALTYRLAIPRRFGINRGRRSREAEIPFPRIWHRAGSKGSEAPAGPVLVLNRGRKKVRGGLES